MYNYFINRINYYVYNLNQISSENAYPFVIK